MLRIHRVLLDPSILPEDFWSSGDSELMIDQRWATEHEDEIQFLAEHLPSHKALVWLASSGTMSTESKWIGLSKDALLKNAKSVIDHLSIEKNDRWALSLPLSHVGGLSIHARSFILKAPIERDLGAENIHWISLVPTQVYDLIQQQQSPPQNLKGALVGGDAISTDLYEKAIALKWPLLRTYGMSELGSQLATEKKIGGGLKVLSHAELKFESEQTLVKSKCLYSMKVVTDFKTLEITPRTGDWWVLPDVIEQREDQSINVMGRSGSVVKILGVKLDLMSLEHEISSRLGFEVVVSAQEDERKGKSLILFSEHEVDLANLNKQLLGFQKISRAEKIKFERTSLGKIKRGQLG